jgi:hypothetical protein
MFEINIFNAIILIVSIIVLTVFGILIHNVITKTDIQDATSDFKLETKYKNQVKLLSDKYNPVSSAKRPVIELLNQNIIPDEEQCFVNFYSLGCRYTGYIGPMNEGYWDPDLAIQLAINAGCRTFILEIDYLDECRGETIK